MKSLNIAITLALTLLILTSCTVNINYPQNHIVDYITAANDTTAEPIETTGVTDTTDITDTTAAEDTTAAPDITKFPEHTETADATDTTFEPITETIATPAEETTVSQEPVDTESENTDTETTAYLPPIHLSDVTSPIGKNQTATVSILGRPNTEYSIEVFYTTGKSTAKGLENKISSDIGFVTWSWKIGPSVKAGFYKIVITGGNQSCEAELQVN